MTTQVREETIESIKQTCFDCIDYDGQTVTWQSVLDGYLEEILDKALSQARQEGVEEAVRFIEDKYELGLEAVINYFKSKNLKSHDLLEQGEG